VSRNARALCAALTLTACSGVMPAPDSGTPDAGFQDLFNGTDFTGWQRYLGSPMPGAAPLGLENDPDGVFRMEMIEGEPAIHISGQVWGSLISIEDYGDFELTGEFKWGTRSWPPLNFLDSGLMYLSHGPYGAVNAGGMPLSSPSGSGAFMVSMELQISPGDVGGIYDLGPIAFTAGPRVHGPELDGGWNTVRIVFQNGTASHFLNDAGVASGSGFTDTWPDGGGGALTHGHLQVQCEGGEIFFRRLRIRRL
jgi:hypothetical protein